MPILTNDPQTPETTVTEATKAKRKARQARKKARLKSEEILLTPEKIEAGFAAVVKAQATQVSTRMRREGTVGKASYLMKEDGTITKVAIDNTITYDNDPSIYQPKAESIKGTMPKNTGKPQLEVKKAFDQAKVDKKIVGSDGFVKGISGVVGSDCTGIHGKTAPMDGIIPTDGTNCTRIAVETDIDKMDEDKPYIVYKGKVYNADNENNKSLPCLKLGAYILVPSLSHEAYKNRIANGKTVENGTIIRPNINNSLIMGPGQALAYDADGKLTVIDAPIETEEEKDVPHSTGIVAMFVGIAALMVGAYSIFCYVS